MSDKTPPVDLVAENERLRVLLDNALRNADDVRLQAEQATHARNAFLASLSHEVRTPLTAILGFTDLLIEEGNLAEAPAFRVEQLYTIKRNGQQLARILNDILDLSKIEAGQLEIESLDVRTGR